MGSFLNGGSRNKPRYERLPLDTFYPSDSAIARQHGHGNLEDDNLLFDLENASSQNGRLLPAKNGYDSEEEIEFYKDTRRSRKQGTGSTSSCCCLVCLLIILLIVVLLFCTLFLIGPSATNSEGWTSAAYQYGSETAIRLYDVNQDGVQDVILGATTASSLDDIDNELEFCKKLNMTYPCAGLIIALDGRNGTRLWMIQTKVEVFAIQCGKLDINGDGQMDCIAAGRVGTLHGFDPIKGEILWSADPNVTNLYFNFYQGQVVPDLDQDGVQDFVVTHGGDTRFSEKQLNRPAGRLLLLSGKTGRSLGRYLTLPDGHETYSSITLYTRPSGAIYLLFGSGGETITGSLWMISLRDLYCHVKSITTCSADSLSQVTDLQNKGYAESWGTPLRTLPSGAKEIIRSSSTKGVTVPTELVDMNNDGVEDLVVFLYNSTIVVLNGVNLEPIWSTGNRFAKFETYSNPAPGYFNDDDTIDLLVMLNEGAWPQYESTQVHILDGRNGEVLWSLKAPSIGPVMSSPLTLQTNGQKDAFLFWVQGLSSKPRGEGLEPPGHGIGLEGEEESTVPPGRSRRHGDEVSQRHPCLLSTDVFRAELLLLDRDLALMPLRLASVEASKYNYSLTEEDRQYLKNKSHSEEEPFAVETAPPDTHVTPSSQSAPLSTTAMVTDEDLARHNLHHHMTTPANAVTTPENLHPSTEAVALPEGLELSTIAVTSPEEAGPSTEATLSEELESTTIAVTSPEGQESLAAMSTSETIGETTLKQETEQTTLGEVIQSSSLSSTAIMNGTEILPVEPANEGETTPYAMSETTVNAVSTTSETANTPVEDKTTETLPETTTESGSSTTVPEATTESSQTTEPEITTDVMLDDTGSSVLTTEKETPVSQLDSATSASTFGLPTLTPETTATSELAAQSTQLPTTGLEETPQPITSESKTGTLSPEDATSQTEVASSPLAANMHITSSSNDKSETDMKPNLFNQTANISSVELTTVTTNDDENSELVTEIQNNDQSTQNTAELLTGQVTSTDLETSAQQKAETASNPAEDTQGQSNSDGDKMRRRREIPGSDLCSVYRPSLLGTGIIGDSDNDGNLEYIYAETHMANLNGEDSSYLTTKMRLRVHRLVLKSAIERRDWVRLEEDGQVMLSKGVRRDEVDAEELEEHFQFLPADEQGWTAYMGENGEGRFRKDNR